MLLKDHYNVGRRMGLTIIESLWWLIEAWTKTKWCRVAGHNLVEEADAEAGGGELYCVRCGWSHTYYW